MSRRAVAWRDLLTSSVRGGPSGSVTPGFSRDGTRHNVLTHLLAQADAAGQIDCAVSIDSTINRTHQHAATLPRTTGGRRQSQESGISQLTMPTKAYSTRAIRAELRRRGINVVIPEPRDQQGHRTRRASRGCRPVTYDVDAYRGRNVVERSFNALKLARARNPLRQARHHLPRRRRHGRDPRLASEPNSVP